MSKVTITILVLALALGLAAYAPAQEIDSFVVVDSICFPEADSIFPVGVDGYGDYLWFADFNSDSGYRVDLSGSIISGAELPVYGGHASAFYVDSSHVYYGPIIDRALEDPTWSSQVSGTSNTLEDVYFVDYFIGWAVGTYGTILHTTDGGDNWVVQSSGTTWHIYGVYFLDPYLGWAVGPADTILYTTNGGTDWNHVGVGVPTWFEDVRFTDANIGWAVGGHGAIIHTTDGGVSWTLQSSGTSNTLYATSFVTSDSGWAVGENGTILGTTDGGNTWNTQTSGTANHLFGVFFSDHIRGWAVGYAGTVLRTWDGGNTWSLMTSGTSEALYDVQFFGSRGWAVGANGTIMYSTDAGGTWNPQSSGTSNALLGSHFVDTYNGWAVGDHGTILRYSNGWYYLFGIIKFDWDWNVLDTLKIPPIPYDPVSLGRSEDLGFDGTRWWIAGRYGDIYSWAPPETDLTFEFHHPVSDSGDHMDGMEVVRDRLYLAEMFTDTIYQYDKAGNLLTKYVYSGEGSATFMEGMGFDPNGHFWYASGWSTHCLYELSGIRVAEEICGFFLTPKQLNLKRNAEHTFMIHLDPCESMDVSSGDSAEVYVDVDGSCNFEDDELYPAVVISPSMIIKIYCPDLVDNDPKVLVYSVNNFPVADTSGNDIVLYLDTFTPGGGPKVIAQPEKFAISENYPNPFNPVTYFSLDLTSETQVSFVIYNVAGQKVRTLVNEVMPAGSHTLIWDGTNQNGEALSSGAYFYRVVAGDEMVTKKMTLLK